MRLYTALPKQMPVARSLWAYALATFNLQLEQIQCTTTAGVSPLLAAGTR